MWRYSRLKPRLYNHAPDDDAPAKCLQKFNFLQKLNFSALGRPFGVASAASKPKINRTQMNAGCARGLKTEPSAATISTISILAS